MLYCVHCGHLFPVGNKTLHIFKGGYIVDTLKFLATLIGATLFQGIGIHHLEGTQL